VKLLLAENDTSLSEDLSVFLTKAGFEVEHVDNIIQAEKKLCNSSYDIALLALDTPSDCINIITQLRTAQRTLPIILMATTKQSKDCIAGLSAGADDCLTKPFAFDEMLVRIQALLRRCLHNKATVRPHHLQLDWQKQLAWIGNVAIKLSSRELAILSILLTKPGDTVTKQHIAEQLRDKHHVDLGDNAVEVYIHRLRKKVEPSGINIRTIWRLGYLVCSK